MSREREPRSRVKRRRKGCVTGCLVNILLVLGVLSLLFVGACVLGVIKNDPQTGAPSISFEQIGLPQLELGDVELPDVSKLVSGITWPSWAYSVSREGLTVKTLRASDGEAVLVCCDGYTLLCGAGGSGLLLDAQLLLSGVNRLSALAALSADSTQTQGMSAVIGLTKPEYLIYQDSQTKTAPYNEMLAAAQKQGSVQGLVPTPGVSFSLGQARVTFIGPTYTRHTDERNDGLSLRIDYGNTSVLIMGTIAADGEREILSSGVRMDATALICARGGSDAATCQELVAAVQPKYALMTGKAPANSVQVRLKRMGAQVYTAKEHGVMTLFSDGQTMRVVP